MSSRPDAVDVVRVVVSAAHDRFAAVALSVEAVASVVARSVAVVVFEGAPSAGSVDTAAGPSVAVVHSVAPATIAVDGAAEADGTIVAEAGAGGTARGGTDAIGAVTGLARPLLRALRR